MESIVKVDFGEVFRKIFGFDKEENDMKKIEEEAQKHGIMMKTLRNVKRELNIKSKKEGNQWVWILPE